MEENTKSDQWNVWNQYCAVMAANILTFGNGCAIGWVSPALAILSSNESPLESGPLTNEQVSWIGSINCIGAVLGSFSFGYLTSLLGCKRVLLLIAIPSIIFWTFIYLGTNYEHIFIARIIGGLGAGGLQSTILLYISEIANDDNRGRLSGTFLFIRNIGTLIGYIFGATLSYEMIPFICILVPIVFAIIFVILPNTPQFYLRKGQMNKAEDSLKHYKGYRGNTEQEEVHFNTEFDRLKNISNQGDTREKLQIADLCNRSAIKGIGIGIALTIFSILSTGFTMVNYAVMIFQKAGKSVDPYMSSIVMAVVLIFGSLTTTYLADILGRRILNLISLMGCAIGLFLTSIYHYFVLIGCDLSVYAWAPIVTLSFVIFMSSAGIMPLALICSVECLPSKIRTFGMTIVSFTLNFSAFVSVKTFPIIMETLDLHGCLMIYGFGCVLGAIFVFYVLKETSGQSLDDIDVRSKNES